VGTADNGNDADLLKFTFDVNAGALSSPVTLVTATYIRDAYDICTLQNGHTYVVSAVTDAHTPDCLNKHVLLGFELDATNQVVGTRQLASSLLRSGDTYGAVSVISPDGVTVEVYYEAFNKQLSFSDNTFNVMYLHRDASGNWDTNATQLTTFTARYTDSRMTVVAAGTSRYVNQVFYSQVVHYNGLIGSLLLGHFDGTAWLWHITPGSQNGGSVVQSVLSVAANKSVSVAYISKPMYAHRGVWDGSQQYQMNDRVVYNKADYVALHRVKSTLPPNQDMTNWALTPTAWPMNVANVDLATMSLTNVPGFYNKLNFTWLRGSKSTLDDKTKWCAVGERLTSEGVVPVFVSNYNVPPNVYLTGPQGGFIHRGIATTFSASTTFDDDRDALTYTWVYAGDTGKVSLDSFGATATVKVDPSIGGDSHTFRVAVVATDSVEGVVLHPALNVTAVSVASNTVTVTCDSSVSLAAGEKILLYNLTNADFLNAQVLTLSAVSGKTFSASFTHADYSQVDTGFAITEPQFAALDITVSANLSPVIDFSTDAISGQPVTLPIQANRNTSVTLRPKITGITDIDDMVTFKWEQISGTPVVVLGTLDTNSLTFMTNGTDLFGETLTFKLTVTDNVNSPVSSSVDVVLPAYVFTGQDSHVISRSIWQGDIAHRNVTGIWSPLYPSVMFTDLRGVKRASVLNGSSRYIVISPFSVIIYGDGVPPKLYRKIFIPGAGAGIADAVHTESDYTLVLDELGHLYRYPSTSALNTDNPDKIIRLSSMSSLDFKKVFCTSTYADVRVITLSGSGGCLLIQVKNSDLSILGYLELTTKSKLIYGADNVQWVRTSNVESLTSGKVFLGTISSISANIYKVKISQNCLTVATDRQFVVGEDVLLSGLKVATFLNNVKVKVLKSTSSTFTASFSHANYPETEDIGTVSTPDASYETLIDLQQGKVLGTWDASKLRNQFVTSGEILFETEGGYTGKPLAPILSAAVSGGTVTFSWVQQRPDLVSGYIIERSNDSGANWAEYQRVNTGMVTNVTCNMSSGQYQFRMAALSKDGNSPYSNVLSVTVVG
jgi:hypothetical protein